MSPANPEIAKVEERLRAELIRIDGEAKQTRHAIRGDIQQILIELAEQSGKSSADKWIMRALIAMTSIETTFIIMHLGKLYG